MDQLPLLHDGAYQEVFPDDNSIGEDVIFEQLGVQKVLEMIGQWPGLEQRLDAVDAQGDPLELIAALYMMTRDTHKMKETRKSPQKRRKLLPRIGPGVPSSEGVFLYSTRIRQPVLEPLPADGSRKRGRKKTYLTPEEKTHARWENTWVSNHGVFINEETKTAECYLVEVLCGELVQTVAWKKQLHRCSHNDELFRQLESGQISAENCSSVCICLNILENDPTFEGPFWMSLEHAEAACQTP